MTSSLKILVCGDVKGNFNYIFNRVATVNKKSGPFSMLLCVGEFFGENNDEWEMYKCGQSKVPVPTYVVSPVSAEHKQFYTDQSGCEMCGNCVYLGHRGTYTTSGGLSIVYVGATVPSNNSADSNDYLTVDDVRFLQQSVASIADFSGVDILLTSCWPKDVDRYASPLESKVTGSELISQLAVITKPRYHIAAGENVTYERQPYRNHKLLQESARHTTRFIALADVCNKEKRKFLYAFNIVPMKTIDSAELNKQPDDVTECPYKRNLSLLNAKPANQGTQYFYDSTALEKGSQAKNVKRSSTGNSADGASNAKKPRVQSSGPCWFCLGSPEVEKHLVVSVGSECYLVMAKGGLTTDHTLITPIEHYQSLTSSPLDTLQEIEQYKTALSNCFAKQAKVMVFFERNYKTQHMQIQAVPVPKEAAANLKDLFIECAASQNIELCEIPKHSDIRQLVSAGVPYFYVELPEEKLFCRTMKAFPLQFGREVLAHSSVLNLPDKVDWRTCHYSREEELEMVSSFRKFFTPFDFTLE